MRSFKSNKCLRTKFEELELTVTSLSKSKGAEQGKLSIFSSSFLLMKVFCAKPPQDEAGSVDDKGQSRNRPRNEVLCREVRDK